MDAAIGHFNAAIEIKPTYTKALYHRLLAYKKKESFDLALKDAQILKEQHFPEAEKEIAELEQAEKAKMEKLKTQTLGYTQHIVKRVDQLKGLGNSILGNFGMSLDNFKLNQNPDGSYNIAYKQ